MKYKRCTADHPKPKVLFEGANKPLINQRIRRQLNYFPSSAVMLESREYEPIFCRPAAAFSIVLTGCASGIVAAVQLTTTPLKQAMTGDRQTIPAGIWNSVMSASHLWL
jgi:hypothetical protein